MAAMATSIQSALQNVRSEFSQFAGDTGLVNLTDTVDLQPGLQWAVPNACRARRIGPFVFFEMEYASTTSAGFVSIPASGNIENTPVIEGVPELFRPQVTSGLSVGPSGRVATYSISTAGRVTLNAVSPNAGWTGTNPLPANERLSCTGVYIGRTV